MKVVPHHGKKGEETGDAADDESTIHKSVTLGVTISVYHDFLDGVIQCIFYRATVPLVNLKRFVNEIEVIDIWDAIGFRGRVLAWW